MSLRVKYGREMGEFLKVCHELSAKGHVTSHGGNLAWRLEEDAILITPTKKNKGLLQLEDLVFISMQGSTLEGTMKPTGETPMYLLLFKERPDVKTIIHAHPRAASAFAITKGKNYLERPVFPEPTLEIGPVPLARYAEPLTQELAENFKPFLDKHNAFLMGNHGVLTMSPECILRCYDLIEIMESTAQSILYALELGPIQELSPEDLANLEKTMTTRNLPRMGRPELHVSLPDLYYPQR